MKLQYGMPINLIEWVSENKDKLAPPVCNAALFPDTSFIINMVGGLNTRTDFHVNPYEEIFYQIRGNAYLILWDKGSFKRIDIKEGEIFLLPAEVYHSPQRPEPGLCLLIEQKRPLNKLDSLQWFCGKCANLIWRAEKQLENLVDDLPKIYEVFYAKSDEERRCNNCGTIHPGRDFKVWHEQVKETELT